jgi:hypothetical protein
LSNKIEFNVLVTGVQKISNAMGKTSQSLEDFSRVAKNLGRELGQVGQIVSLLGASISGPLVLAFNNAAKSSAAVSEQVKNLQNITAKFQKDVAVALVPIFEKLNNILSNLYSAFSSLDQALKNQLLQDALLAGVFLTLSGVLTIIVAKIFSLVSNLAGLASKLLLFVSINLPMVAVGISLAVIVGLMIKFKGVADVVLNTFQVLFLFLKNGFLTISIALEGIIFSIAQNALSVVGLISKIPGPTQAAMLLLYNDIQNLSNNMRAGINQDIESIVENADVLGQIFSGWQGTWAEGFENLKIQAEDLWKKMSDPSAINNQTIQWKDMIDKLKNWWKDGGKTYKTVQEDMVGSLTSSLQQAAQLNAKWAMAYKAVGIGVAIISTAAGIAQAFEDYSWPFSLIVAGIVAAAGAVQIATIASQQFAVGSPDIPRDMVANVHKGETIIPETFADSIRKGDLTLSGQGGQGGNIILDFTNTVFNGVTQEFVTDIFTKASESIANRTLTFRSA